MTDEIKCAKCGGGMRRGFIFDRGHYDYKSQQMWVEGEPEETFWSGIKTSGRNAYNVGAYRCDGCGSVELFTTEQVDLKNSLFT